MLVWDLEANIFVFFVFFAGFPSDAGVQDLGPNAFVFFEGGRQVLGDTFSALNVVTEEEFGCAGCIGRVPVEEVFGRSGEFCHKVSTTKCQPQSASTAVAVNYPQTTLVGISSSCCAEGSRCGPSVSIPGRCCSVGWPC